MLVVGTQMNCEQRTHRSAGWMRCAASFIACSLIFFASVSNGDFCSKKIEKIMHSVPTTRQVTLQPNLLDRNTLKIISGIASALVILIDGNSNSDHHALFDEFSLSLPLCDPALHIISFSLQHGRGSKQFRRYSIETFLKHLAVAMQFDMRELVLAFIILECIVREDPKLLTNQTVRLLFITTASFAMKLLHDCEITTVDIFKFLQDLVLGIDCNMLQKMEWHVLSILNYSLPVASKHVCQSCILYTVKLMAEAGVYMTQAEARRKLFLD